MEGPISFWGYNEQESNLILREHDDDDEVIFWCLQNKEIGRPGGGGGGGTNLYTGKCVFGEKVMSLYRP